MPWNGSEVASVQLSGSLIRRWHRLVYPAKLNYFECKFAFRSEEMAEKIPCCARSRERERETDKVEEELHVKMCTIFLHKYSYFDRTFN